MTTINEDIIIKFLSGQATEAEASEILRWKNSDEANRKTFREIEVAFNTSEIILDPEKFDPSVAYPRLQFKLKRKRLVFIPANRIKRFAGYAATAVIAIGLTWFAQHYFSPQPDFLEPGQPVYQSVETPAGAKSLITLEDGTRVWLNAKSKLVYPAHFASHSREVQLEGEGYFDVAKDKSKPFNVKTSHLNIHVLGTVFNLKSYPAEGLIEATLVEGKITMNRLTGENQEKQLLELKPYQQATFIKKEGFLTADEAAAANISPDEANLRSKEHLVVAEHIDPDTVAAWKDNKLVFKNETFESIALKLERTYDAKIIFEDEAVKHYRFSGVFSEISINEALKALQFSSGFSFKIEHRTILIRR